MTTGRLILLFSRTKVEVLVTYIVSMEKETKIVNWEQDFFVHHTLVSAVKKVEFVSDRMSCIVLRICWCNISPDGRTHNQLDHILIDRRWDSSILDVCSFRGADCDTDHYLVVAEVWERLVVSKQAAENFDVERFNLRKLQVRKQYKIKKSNRFAALENLNDRQDIKNFGRILKENVKTTAKESLGLYGLKQHAPWFDGECLHFLD